MTEEVRLRRPQSGANESALQNHALDRQASLAGLVDASTRSRQLKAIMGALQPTDETGLRQATEMRATNLHAAALPAQRTVQEAVELAHGLLPGLTDQIQSWQDIDLHKYFFTPEQRSQLRAAANQGEGSTQLRPSWVEPDKPRSCLLNDEKALESMVGQVLSLIETTIRDKGPGLLATQLLRQIPYVGILLDMQDIGNELDNLSAAVQGRDGGRAATAATSIVSTLFGLDRLGYAATGIEAVRTRATSYVLTTRPIKRALGKQD